MQGEGECDLLASLMEGLKTEGNPHRQWFILCLSATVATFVLSTVTDNVSQVDWVWSLLPVAYTWMAAVDDRTILMACLVTMWMLRMKWCFHRRYGFPWPPWTREEDYRWAVIREGGLHPVLTNKVAWVTFNFVVVSLYQNVLLLLFSSPSLVAWTVSTSPACQSEAVPLNLLGMDGLAAVLFVLSVAVETVADNQQYAFQTEKYRRIDRGEVLTGEYADGFCQSGLFALLRKPNYAAEQCVWISFYLFSVASRGAEKWNWSVLGCILLVHLFHASGKLTEGITMKKYPKYAEYMESVPLYVPFLPKRKSHKKD